MGPTQSGKTSGLAVPAILEWEGPVVATSVKTDLLDDTLAARTRRGDLWVHDPTATVCDLPASAWSPLAGRAEDGDMSDGGGARRQLARRRLLVRERPPSSVLFAAATSGRTMADVVRWIDL